MTATESHYLPSILKRAAKGSTMTIDYYGFTIDLYWVMVTRDLAAHLLEYNTRNRSPKIAQIERYASDILGNTWLWNGSTICVSGGPDPVLLDGQNRLTAVVKAGKPIWSLVVVGLPLSSQDEMDNGSSRTFADTLSIAGEKNPSKLASLVRSDLQWQTGLRDPNSRTSNFSRSQLQKHLDLHPEIRDVLNVSDSAARKFDINPTLASQCALLFWRIDEEDCREFWKRLGSIGGGQPGDPISTLQSALVTAQAEKRRGRPMSAKFKMAIILKSWNAFRNGQEVKVLKFKAGGARPDKFPTPI